MQILLDKRLVYIENFYFGYTYAGLLLGKPSKEINSKIIAEIKPPSYWPYNAFIKAPIDNEKVESTLPSCYFHAVVSSTPLNADFCGSGFVLTWLADFPDDKPISDIVLEGLKQVVWEDCAKDFDF